jgi:Class-II DAHP synthetase family
VYDIVTRTFNQPDESSTLCDAMRCSCPLTTQTLQDGVSLPSYRGDIINGPEFTAEARIPDPNRLVRAYNQSAATMNLLRAFSTGGYAGLDRVTKWNLDFMENTKKGAQYQEVAHRVDESLQFMRVRCILLRCCAWPDRSPWPAAYWSKIVFTSVH